LNLIKIGGSRSRDRMVVGFITTYAMTAYHHWCCEFEFRSGQGVQHYVMKFVGDLRQVCGIHDTVLFHLVSLPIILSRYFFCIISSNWL